MGRGGLRRALVLALATIVLNAPFVGWGAPHATGPDRTLTFATDDVLPLGPLAEMHNTFVESKPDRNYAYPWWHYFVLAGAQSPYLGWLLATGGMDSPTPEYPFGLADPVTALFVLTVIGRLVSVVMAGGIVACAYSFSRTLWGETAGWIAGLLALSNPWIAYYARTGNLDVPALFWTALGLVAFAHVLRSGFSPRRAAWLGAFAGIAMATKDQALAIFLPLAVVLLLPRFSRDPGGRYSPRPVLVGLLVSLGAFAVCTGMLVDPMRQITHIERLFFDQRSLTASHLYWNHVELSPAGVVGLAVGFCRALAEALTPLGLAASVIGLLLLLRGPSRGSVVQASIALPVLVTFVLLTLATGIVVRRYLVPLVFPLDALAAFALATVIAGRRRLLGLGVVAGVVILRGSQTVDLTFGQVRETRTAAAAWIAENARDGDRLEYFGHNQKLPALPAEISSRRILGRGAEWEGETGHGPSVLAYLASSDGPELVIVVPDWTSRPGMLRSQDCPPEVFTALEEGTTGYRRVAEFPARHLFSGPFSRPVLDSPSVGPPVRIYARDDVAEGR